MKLLLVRLLAGTFIQPVMLFGLAWSGHCKDNRSLKETFMLCFLLCFAESQFLYFIDKAGGYQQPGMESNGQDNFLFECQFERPPVHSYWLPESPCYFSPFSRNSLLPCGMRCKQG